MCCRYGTVGTAVVTATGPPHHHRPIPSQIKWQGFEEPESRISSYAYCVGSTPSACDYEPMRDVEKSTAATVLNPIPAAQGEPVYIVVRCTNTQQLETAVTATIIMNVGVSTFDYVKMQDPVTATYIALEYHIDEDSPVYTNSTELGFRLKLSPVGAGLSITAMEWAHGRVRIPLPGDTFTAVGQFDKLKETPHEPITTTLDLREAGVELYTPHYIHFRVTNSLNQVAVWTVLFVYDDTNPLADTAPAIVQRSASGWSTAQGSLFVCWAYTYPAAPVNTHVVEIHDALTGPIQTTDTPPGSTDYVAATTTSSCTVVPNLPLVDGRRYFARITAISTAGLSTVNVSAPAPVDTSTAECVGTFTANTEPQARSLLKLQHSDVDDASHSALPRTYISKLDSFSFLFGCGDAHSAIANLSIAITTNASFVAGGGRGPNILPFRFVTPVTESTQDLRQQTVEATDKDLAADIPVHSWLYGIVAATNGAGLRSAGYGGAVMIDPTPPELNSSNVALVDGAHARQTQLDTVVYQQSRTTLRVVYNEAFVDDESGVRSFTATYWKYASTPRHDLAAEWLQGNNSVATGLLAAHNFTGLTLSDGDSYVMAVSAENKAGLTTAAVTPRVMVDGSPPAPFVAWLEDRYVGSRASADSCGPTGECPAYAVFQKDRAKITVQWQRASDPHSRIKRIELAVLRLPNTTASGAAGTLVAPVLTLHDKQRSKWTIPLPSGALLQGSTYRVRVTAVNWAEGKRVAFTNTVTIDRTPPVFRGRRPSDNTHQAGAPTPSVVTNEATGALEVFVQNADTYTIEWRAFDEESHVFAYIVSLGTAPGDTDIVRQSIQCGTGCGSYPDCTPATLACDASALQTFEVQDTRVEDAQAVYVFAAVEAINQAGVSSIATTQGRLIDPDNPIIDAVIDGWANDADYVSVDDGRLYTSWLGVHDETSGIHKRTYAVTQQADSLALEDSDYTSVPATVGTRMAIALQLLHGERYYVHLRVEDKAERFARASSTGVLVDYCAPTVDFIRPVDGSLDLAFTNSTQGAKLTLACLLYQHSPLLTHWWWWCCVLFPPQSWRCSGAFMTPRVASSPLLWHLAKPRVRMMWLPSRLVGSMDCCCKAWSWCMAPPTTSRFWRRTTLG